MLPASWSVKQGYTPQQIKKLETLERFCIKATHMEKEDPRLYNLMQKINSAGIISGLWNENLAANDRLHALRHMFEDLQVFYMPASTPSAPQKASSSSSSDSSLEDPLIGDSSPIEILSEDALYTVLSFLDPTSAVAASKVCKAWQSLNRSLLWEGANHPIRISDWQDYIGYVIDCLKESNFPLERILPENNEELQTLTPDAIEALQNLSKILKTAPKTLPEIFHRDHFIVKEIQEILDRMGFRDQNSLKRLYISIELSSFKNQFTDKEFSAFKNAYDNNLQCNLEKLKLWDHALFNKALNIKVRTVLRQINMGILICTPDPEFEEIPKMKLLLKFSYWKDAWLLLNRVTTRTESLRIGEDLSFEKNSRTCQKLSQIWTKNLPKTITILVALGDDESACRLANSQEQELKIELLQKIGITYARFNRAEHVKPILELLDKEGTEKAIKSQSKILKALALKEFCKGNFEGALHYFESLRPFTKAREQLLILNDLAVTSTFETHLDKKETMHALLQKELPNLLQELSKDTAAYQGFFSNEAFSLISLLCQMEEVEQAQGLMDQALLFLVPKKEKNAEFITQLIQYQVFLLLCRMGRAPTAQKLMDQAIEIIWQMSHKHPELFAMRILGYKIPSLLCKIGDPAKAEKLVVSLINRLREFSSEKEFFKIILNGNLLLFFCETGQIAKARELMEQAIAALRRGYPGTNEFFQHLVKRQIFVNLCAMGDIDEAERLFARMPDSNNVLYSLKHNEGLKRLARKLLEDMITAGATSQEGRDSLDKVVRILGMLIRDPNKYDLIEAVSNWKEGDELPLCFYTQSREDSLQYFAASSSSSSSSSDSSDSISPSEDPSDSTSESDSSNSAPTPAVPPRHRFLISSSSDDSTPSDSTPSSSGSGSD